MVSVTDTVPACVAVNVREAEPLTVSFVAKRLVVGEAGAAGASVDGEVGLWSVLLHPAVSARRNTTAIRADVLMTDQKWTIRTMNSTVSFRFPTSLTATQYVVAFVARLNCDVSPGGVVTAVLAAQPVPAGVPSAIPRGVASGLSGAPPGRRLARSTRVVPAFSAVNE